MADPWAAAASAGVRNLQIAERGSEQGDATVLCDFYNTMSAAGQATLTNWCGAKTTTGSYVNGPCKGTAGAWYGVTCAVVGGVSRVTSLGFTYGLCGSLPTSIGGLDALASLGIAHCGISGKIPSTLGALTGLTNLVLLFNYLTGSIPSTLGALTGLNYLRLDSNALTGPVPVSFCSLKPTIQLSILINPGLTCYPPCLASFTSFTKDASLRGCGDEQVLCALYNTMPATGKAKLTNWCGAGDASSVCVGNGGTSSWLGVACAVVGGASRVTKLDTCQYTPAGCALVTGIGGSLPTSIGGLDALTRLAFTYGSLTGSIPSALGGLTGLTYLHLAANSLSGSIPSSLGGLTGLTLLGLHANLLSGSIPFSLGSLTGLTFLGFGTNSLSGSIPPALGGLTGLTELWLDTNSLCGSIPSSLGGLSRLSILTLNTNALSGPVPTSFCSLKPSITLAVQGNPGLTCYPPCLTAHNSFTKEASLRGCGDEQVLCAYYAALAAASKAKLTNWCGASHVCDTSLTAATAWTGVKCDHIVSSDTWRVTQLTLGQLSLGGSIPSSLGTLDALRSLSLAGNQLVGSVPSSIGLLSALSALQLGHNSLGGSLPASLGGLTALSQLSCASNRLSSTLPGFLGGLSALTLLDLSGNKLGGNGTTAVAALGRLVRLTSLSLSTNLLSGSLPGPQLGLLTRLTNLQLDHNGFAGSVPSQIGTLTRLTALGLSGNQLTGSVPQSFCAFKPTIALTLQGNLDLICYPSCLANATVYRSFQKDCPACIDKTSAPTASPTVLPSAQPTPVPTPLPTAGPSAVPSQYPTTSPSPMPSPVPTAVPTQYPSYNMTGRAVKSVYCNIVGGTCALPSAVFTNLDAGSGLGWYLTVEVYGTRWGSNFPSVTFSLIGAATAVLGTSDQEIYCNPGDACGGSRTYPSSAGPARCIMNKPVSVADLNLEAGGSFVITAALKNVSPFCKYLGYDVYITYTLTATDPQPTYRPSAAPTASPNTGSVVAQPSPSPTVYPTAPTAAPSPLPTVSPSSLPTQFPSYAQISTVSRHVSSSNDRIINGAFQLEAVTFTNLNANANLNWFLEIGVAATGFAGGKSAFAQVKITGGAGSSRLPYSTKCNPGTACDADQYTFDAPLFQCLVNFKITPQDLDPADGGSLTLAATTNFRDSTCFYDNVAKSVFIQYTLTATYAVPTFVPTATPSVKPTPLPSSLPTLLPTQPSPQPTAVPSAEPTQRPSAPPTTLPSAVPTTRPTAAPSALPTTSPTSVPTPKPSSVPTTPPSRIPTPLPTAKPTAVPTPEPSEIPSPQPSALPTLHPTYSANSGAIELVKLGADSQARSGVFSTPEHSFTNLNSGDLISTWYLNVDIYATGFGAESKVFVTLRGYTPSQGQQEEMKGESELSRDLAGGSLPKIEFPCTPPVTLHCGPDDKPLPYRCPELTNFPISTSQLASQNGGYFTIVTATKNAKPDAECPVKVDNKANNLYVTYSLSTVGSPTPMPTFQPSPQPTTAAPNFALLIASQQGAQDVVISQGAPVYVVGVAAAVFALIGMMLYQTRNISKHDTAAKNEGDIVSVGLVPMIMGAALIGSAFISECFLIQILLSQKSTEGLGGLVFVGRLVHLTSAVLLIYLCNKSRTRRVFKRVRPLKPLYNIKVYNHNLSIFGGLFLLCTCDVTLMRFMPWLDSQFAQETNGYPSPFVFFTCVYSKLVQSLFTIAAQSLLLRQLLETTTGMPPSLLFLCVNMAVTVLVFLVNALEAVLRSTLVNKWTTADVERGQGRPRAGSRGADGASFTGENPASALTIPGANGAAALSLNSDQISAIIQVLQGIEMQELYREGEGDDKYVKRQSASLSKMRSDARNSSSSRSSSRGSSSHPSSPVGDHALSPLHAQDHAPRLSHSMHSGPPSEHHGQRQSTALAAASSPLHHASDGASSRLSLSHGGAAQAARPSFSRLESASAPLHHSTHHAPGAVHSARMHAPPLLTQPPSRLQPDARRDSIPSTASQSASYHHGHTLAPSVGGATPPGLRAPPPGASGSPPYHLKLTRHPGQRDQN